jgi:hypothetical protein
MKHVNNAFTISDLLNHETMVTKDRTIIKKANNNNSLPM